VAQSLTNFASMLKLHYRQMVLNLMNNEIAIYNRCKRAPSEVWEGRDVIKWPLITGRSQAFGSGRPGGALPDPQHTPTADMEVPLRFIWGSIGIDAPTMKVAKSDKGSFARALDFEMDRFKEAFFDYLNEITWADGRGVLALVNVSQSSGTTLTVDSPMGIAGSINGARFLQPSMRIGILSSDGTSVAGSGYRVESIAADGNSVTVNKALTSGANPDNGIICRAPSLLTTDINDMSYLSDPMGMLGMIDDGTYVNDYFGFNRTTQPLARASVFPNVGALNLDIIQQLRDVIDQVGRGKISESWMHHSTRRSYAALTFANRQFISSGGAMDNDAGYKNNLQGKTIECGGVPCYVDKDAPYRQWYDMDWKEAVKFPNTEFEWASESGAILKQVPGVDAFTAYARMFYNMCHGKPLACGRLDDINTNVVVAHVR